MNQSWLKEALQSYLRVRECDIVDKGGGQIMVVVIVGEGKIISFLEPLITFQFIMQTLPFRIII